MASSFFKLDRRRVRVIILSCLLGLCLLWIWRGQHPEPEELVIYPVLAGPVEQELESSVTISFVGDLLLLEDQVKYGLDHETGTYDFSPVFQYARKYLEAADLCIGVLEVPLAGEEAGYSTSNYDDGIPLFLNGPDRWAGDIRDAGIDLVTTANNHAMDKGEAGLFRTLDVLEKIGLDSVGTYKAPADRNNIFIKDVRGLKVAVLAYTCGLNYHDEERIGPALSRMIGLLSPVGSEGFEASKAMLLEDIARARALGPDLIIALPHIGKQFSHEKDEYLEGWAAIMFDHGVDIVFGAGSHAVQPVELKRIKTSAGRERTVALVSCPGNFVNSYHGYDGDAGAIASVHISDKGPDKGRILGASVVPFWIQGRASNLCRVLPVVDAANDRDLRTSLGGMEFERLNDVQKLVTRVMLGAEVRLDQVRDRYYTLPGKGYMRQLFKEKSDDFPVDAGTLGHDRKQLIEKLSGARKTVVLGDSISVGSRNGGYPWFEPIMHFFPGNTFVNWSADGATTLSILKKMDEEDLPQADLFIVALGVNDVRYRDEKICAMTPEQYVAALDRMAGEIRKQNPTASIAFVGPWPAYDNDIFSELAPGDRDGMIERYNDALRRYCLERNTLYIDANGPIRRHMKTRITDDYIVDHIHPNAGAGIRLYGRAVVFGEGAL